MASWSDLEAAVADLAENAEVVAWRAGERPRRWARADGAPPEDAVRAEIVD